MPPVFSAAVFRASDAGDFAVLKEEMGVSLMLSARISVLLFIQVAIIPARGELFTALVHMEGLLDLEMELLGTLNSYITAEKER